MLNKLTWAFLVIIISIHTLVLTKLIYFPYPELFVYPYLTNHGLKPYSQILDQHFPGLMFLPINFDNLGMKNEIIARNWSIGVIILIHLLLFFIASKILKNKQKALMVNLLYLIWQPFFEGWVLWIDSFLPLFLLPCFYFLHKKKLFLSGLLLGFGIVFKQTLIPLAVLLIIYIWWHNKKVKDALVLLEGITVPIALMIIYLFGIGVIKDFWYWTVIFNLTTYAKFGTSIYSDTGFLTRISLVYLTSVIAWFNKDRRLVFILFIFLGGSLIGAFDRASFIHLQPSLPFVVIATTLGFYQLKRKVFFRILILVYLMVSVWWLNIFYKGHISDKVFFFDNQTKMIASKVRQYTKPDDKIFVFGAAPLLYQMSDRLPAGNIFVFQFPWFLQVAGNRILEGIIKDKPKIIVEDREAIIEGQPIRKFASGIDQYIQTNYTVLDKVGNVDILRRISD